MTATARRGKWFLKEPRADASARIFLLPYSGCGATMYRQWPSMRDGVEFCAVQLPGRENRMREPAFDSYEQMALALAEALRPYLDVPFGLFGHCSSALAAFETAARLCETGPAPARLFVSSEVAPQDGPYGYFLGLDDEGLSRELAGLLIGMGVQPHPGLIDLTLGVLRHDVDVNKRYVKPDPPVLSCPITSIGWRDDYGVEPRLMDGWSRCGETQTVLFDGGHYEFVGAPDGLLDLLVRGVR
ncbi:surfactin synthase thioesterase subunit [Micromonospora sp. M71_S20]|uniref:thioesterase II family protein n=1 Tax=Micromonospora sp. M71_S20 TaxID=592872 RepID=UPI000EB327ED|nr:thioesterase domain-containing protein [Micromonospora sp. M71_S20]RLK24881.1 surfactin synthase thioesterase subunit [Micromonospora sp. M71_S20]